jgi:cation diffusion facilitator CzcD-associated flavoprotein CzcO
MQTTEQPNAAQEPQRDYDVIVVGAGFGGLYGVHRFKQLGLSVLGFEGGGGVGGVWYHNRYPGARVDVESWDYCYYFSEELYRDWKWSEKYATQPELMRYLNHVADRFDIRRHFHFDTWVTGAQWDPETARYRVTTSTGMSVTCRFLVMATGQLSAARKPPFEGLDDFKGEWVQTSHWPDREVKLEGRRIAVIGTGSSGVQTTPEVAKLAQQVYVFQRSPNYSVPAWNGPMDNSLWESIREDVPGEREKLWLHPGCSHLKRGLRPAADFSPAERLELIEAAWKRGGHGMSSIFSDQAVNKETNDLIAEFVRNKIRSIVKDPVVAEKLCPQDHPIGTRRLCVDTGYYEAYNRPNVTLVDVRESAIARITPTGIQLENGAHYEVDLIIFALGFHAFKGAMDRAGIRNERGELPSDKWKRGPRTLLGITTEGFPNLFFPTGPGSPSVLANMAPQNEYHVDWIASCITHMDKHGYDSIEPTVEAQDRWTAHVAEVADRILRRQVQNYMVHVNEDGTRVFMPYIGGMDRFARQANEIAAKGYEGFRFGRVREKARAA